MNDLLPQGEKTDAMSRIKKFMSSEESGIILSKKEEGMLARWIYANGLLKERKFLDDDIVDMIVEKFSVSKFTARSDISHARTLFVSLIKDLKKYGLYHHIRELEIQFEKKKNDKAYAPFLSKLADSITRAYAAFREDAEAPDVPAPVLIVNVVGKSIDAQSPDDARKAADELIELERTKDYTEFEELPDES
jgi:hypothetical protein